MKFYIIVTALLLSSYSYALPSFSNAFPVDGAFLGRGAVLFSVNVSSSDLDANSALLFVISEDAYLGSEPWDNYTMSCVQYQAGNWTCSRTVSFSIAGTDTLEFFYFQANDSSGTNTLGTASSPLKFTIDRTPPQIVFVSPANNSFVSGISDIKVNVTDTVSGHNASLLKYSVNGGAWSPMPGGTAAINTASYANNQTVSINVNATDNVGNSEVSGISVAADNEIPFLSVIFPAQGAVMQGTVTFRINVSDAYSGINLSRVSYTMPGSVFSMSCAGGICDNKTVTTDFQDGNYTVAFTAYDNAGNVNSSLVSVMIKNTEPSVSIIAGSYARGTPQINVTASNAEGIVTAVLLEVSNSSSAVIINMSCNSAFDSCSYALDTASYGDGTYTLNASASNVLNKSITDQATLIIDNTNPDVTVTTSGIFSGLETVEAEVTDSNHNKNSVIFKILGNSQIMTCVPQEIRLFCSTQYDFSLLGDGKYNITVEATDHAGNSFASVKEITVDSNAPEMTFIKIEPLNPRGPSDVIITVGIEDKGSGVKSVEAFFSNIAFSSNVPLVKNAGITWSEKLFFEQPGGYEVSISVVDNDGNEKTFSRVGYFYLGELSCGDGICNANENYCLCPADCSAPQCASGETVECASGLPACSQPGSCGDGVCSSSESCDVCSADCGSCISRESITIGKKADSLVEFYNVLFPNLPVVVAGISIFVIALIVAMTRRKSSK